MDADERDGATHFGRERIPAHEKRGRVDRVFRSVARRYDLMNDVMSLGAHRLIKRFAVELGALRAGQTVLDLAGGTGDLSVRLAPLVGRSGRVVLADINEAMLEAGRDRIIDRGLQDNILFVRADAERLPFADGSFDRVLIAYGLRNLTDKAAGLAAMERVLKPGGRALVLEFSKPRGGLTGRAFSAWSSLWPLLGGAFAGDAAGYRYLVESIRLHPDQDALLGMMRDAGFTGCRCHDVLDGVCAVHTGFKADPEGAAP